MAALYKFRVRRGFGGVCVLQQLKSYPTYNGGYVDTENREYKWVDVSYDHAPASWGPVAQPSETQATIQL